MKCLLVREFILNVFRSYWVLFSNNPSENDIKGIAYDRLCDLHPYLVRLGNEDNTTAEKYSKLDYVVNILHAEKHALPKCLITIDQCKYHPDFLLIEHGNM